MQTDSTGILDALLAGLPVLLPQFLATVVLLAVGVTIFGLITPYHERELIRRGNAAAGIGFAGSVIGIAIPLAATLASSTALVDVILWGIVSVVLQLLTFGFAMLFMRDLRAMIEAGNVAAASALCGIQVGVALLNAGAMAG